MDKPFFSVIIPSYNRKDFLRLAVLSVLEQTFKDFELIISDDGSTDQTSQMLKEFNDPRLLYFHQKNAGPAAARNLGLKQAKGEFICFLDSDDRYRSSKLETTYKHIKENPQHDIFHTEELWYRSGELLPQKAVHRKPHGDVFENAVKICSISISTAAVNKRVFANIGGFDEALAACEDYEFWLRATSKYPAFLIPEYLTIKEGGHPDQLSKKFPAMDSFRIYALNKILESGKLNPGQSSIAAKELVAKCRIYLEGAKKRGKIEETTYYQDILEKFSV